VSASLTSKTTQTTVMRYDIENLYWKLKTN